MSGKLTYLGYFAVAEGASFLDTVARRGEYVLNFGL
jgi:hypothetical protein